MAVEGKTGKIRSAERLRIPVRYVDGHWELAYGGAVKVKNGTGAELTIPREALDPELLKVLTLKRWIKVLEEGTELRVALSIRTEIPAEIKKVFQSTSIRPNVAGRLGSESRFVPVWLGAPNKAQLNRKEEKGGLWLALEGVKPRKLQSSAVILPKAVSLEPAISVNHAFTMLSEKLEPTRLAHTASIYQRVFYKEGDEFWYPLDDLRKKEMVVAERKIISALWKQVEARLQRPL